MNIFYNRYLSKMVSIWLEFDVNTGGKSVSFTHPKHAAACKRSVKYSHEDSKYPFVYLIPRFWLECERKFRKEKGSYPGPIDFRDLNSSSKPKKDYGRRTEEFYAMMMSIYGVIGDPIIRDLDNRKKIADPPFDMTLYDFCTKVKSVSKPHALYTIIQRLGFTGIDLEKMYCPEKITEKIILRDLKGMNKK